MPCFRKEGKRPALITTQKDIEKYFWQELEHQSDLTTRGDGNTLPPQRSISNMPKLSRKDRVRQHAILCSDSEEDVVLTEDDKYDKLEVSLFCYSISELYQFLKSRLLNVSVLLSFIWKFPLRRFAIEDMGKVYNNQDHQLKVIYDTEKQIMEISYSKSRVKANAGGIINIDVLAGIEEIQFFEKDDDIPGLDTGIKSFIFVRSDVRKRLATERITKSQIENKQLVLEFETNQDMHDFLAAVESDYEKGISAVPPEDVEVIAPSLLSDSKAQRLSRKDRARQHVCKKFITCLGFAFKENEHWNLNPKSFDQNDDENPPNPLANVEFDPKTRRYTIRNNNSFDHPKKKKRKVVVDEKEKKSSQNDDDAIAQAMVVYLLYRLERGWGNPRSFKALSVWNGKPHNDGDDEEFPLENLWEQDISEWIASKRLGPTTLGHFDNWDSFPSLYAFADGRWARRNHTYKTSST